MNPVLVLIRRYLRTKPVALVALLSVAAGVAAMIVLVSLMDGVLGFLREHYRGTEGDLVLRHPDVRGLDPAHGRRVEDALVRAGPAARAIVATSPRFLTQALLVPGERPNPALQDRIQGAILIGVDFEREMQVVPLQQQMEAVRDQLLRVPEGARGDPLRAGRRPRILLGDALARRLGVHGPRSPDGPGLVTVVVATPRLGEGGRPEFEEPRTLLCEVAGTFSSGREDYDRLRALMDRRTLLELRHGALDRGADATLVAARVAEGTRAGDAARALRRALPGLDVRTWEEEHRNELRSIEDQKRILVVILFFIVAVATVAVLGVVGLMIADKTREIGALRAMGMSSVQVLLAFGGYGLAIGGIGAGLGAGAGALTAQRLDGIVAWISHLAGVPLLNPEIYRFESIPTRLETGTVLSVAALAALLSLLAALVPALRAARLSPARCLHTE